MFFKYKKTLSVYLNKNKFWFFLLAVIFAAGVYMGVSAASGTDLSEFNLESVYPKDSTNGQIIAGSFLKNLKFLAWICISAMSVVGVPAIMYLIYSKGMAIGCTVYAMLTLSSASRTMLVLSMIPQMLFLIMSFIFIGQFGICFSVGLVKKVFSASGGRYDLSAKIVPFAANILFSCLCVFVSAIAETVIKVNIY